jgi:glycosyltransferase involved in cell wall biosynthesis
MRIACHNGARIWGGQERATVRLLAGLRDRGHEVVLLCNNVVVIEQALERGVPARRCVIGGDAMLPHAFTLARELRRIRPDVFIVGTYKKLFLAALGARMARVPRVVARIGLESDIPSRHAKYRFALKRWTDGVVVIAQGMVAPFAELDGFGAQRVELIHNGVRQPPKKKPSGSVRQELGIPADTFVIGTLARLDRQKRLDRLLDAMALLPEEIHCIIAGSGNQGDTLIAKSAALGLGHRVHFAGERDDIGDVVSAMDLYVVSSDREGHSNSMLEAMSWRVPVVSTPVSGANDSILGGGAPAGIVTDFTAESIADAILSLRNNPPLLAAMAGAAVSNATQRFSMEVMLQKWEAFLAYSNEGTLSTK